MNSLGQTLAPSLLSVAAALALWRPVLSLHLPGSALTTIVALRRNYFAPGAILRFVLFEPVGEVYNAAQALWRLK